MKITSRIGMILLFFTILSMIGCKDESMKEMPYLINSTEYDGKLELVWQVPLSSPTSLEDTVQYISMPTILNDQGNRVIFSRYTPLSPSPDGDEVLFSLDANSGNLIWEMSSLPWTGTGRGAFLRNGNVLYNSYHDMHSIDELSGEVNWSYFIDRNNGSGGYPASSLIDDYIYHFHISSPLQRPDASSLVRSNILDGQNWDTIYTARLIDEGFHPYLTAPSKWNHSNGNEVLVFQNRSYRVSPQTGRVDVVAYDVTSDSILWRVDNLDDNSNGQSLLISNGKVFILLNDYLLCLDMHSGDELWRKDDFDSNEWLVVSSIIEAEGKIIVHPSQKKMYALDPDTGAEIWVSDQTGETPSELTYHNGIVYYSSSGDGKLYAVRVSTGEVIWAEKSPNNHIDSRAIFKNKVAIHPDLGVLYASDSFFAMSIRLPE